jgi:hypothetical protein
MTEFLTRLPEEEQQYMLHLLQRRHAELIHELHHAATRRFKEGLKDEIQLTERLMAALEPAHV